MKHTLITRALATFVLSLAVCAGANAGGKTDGSTGNKAGLSLMDAIEQTAEKITADLPKGSRRVAIVAFESANDNLSDYIMEELTGALFDRKIEVADRQNLEYVYKELKLQMSGDVSDESAKSVGKFLAADMVITGQLLDLDGMYRYRTSVISVETAVRASVTRLNVRSDAAARRMMAALANQKTTVKVAKYGVSADSTPQTAGTFLDRGIMFASRGDYKSAIADFDEAIRIDPNMSAAYMLRGRALFASASEVTAIEANFSDVSTTIIFGNVSAERARVYDSAIADFTRAIQLSPDSARAYSERGDAYTYKGDYDRAIADQTQAIRLDPDYASAYNSRGVAYSAKRDLDRAISDYSQAIRLNPNFEMAYNNRGNAYKDKGDYDKAIADFTQAIGVAPNFEMAYDNRGCAYTDKGDYDKAIADFTQAIGVAPNYASAYYNRGYVYHVKGDKDKAIADYTQAIGLDPNFEMAYNNRGVAYANKGDYDRAITDWEAVLRIDPNNASVKRNIETARQRRGR